MTNNDRKVALLFTIIMTIVYFFLWYKLDINFYGEAQPNKTDTVIFLLTIPFFNWSAKYVIIKTYTGPLKKLFEKNYITDKSHYDIGFIRVKFNGDYYNISYYYDETFDKFFFYYEYDTQRPADYAILEYRLCCILKGEKVKDSESNDTDNKIIRRQF